MRQIKTWTQYYVNWLTRLGIIRFSLLLALFIIVMAVTIQIGVTMLLRGTVDIVDIVRSVFFGLLVTPWAAYFLTAVVDELEELMNKWALSIFLAPFRMTKLSIHKVLPSTGIKKSMSLSSSSVAS